MYGLFLENKCITRRIRILLRKKNYNIIKEYSDSNSDQFLTGVRYGLILSKRNYYILQHSEPILPSISVAEKKLG